jgi:hypothetical protein
VIQKITARRNSAVSIRNNIWCGGTYNINTYITNLNLMLTVSIELKTMF